jgi:pimeloyl-ACP methyl ester carboxylesterase
MIALALSTEQRALVERVLKRELPEAAVWVFGSRATSVTKPFSDLDLALDLGASLPVERLAALREAFESAFAHRFRVITVDWPGHGASGSDTQPASARRYAALLAGLVDAMGLGRPILFGNSMGGAAALALAESQPERMRALVLCNPGGLDPGGFFAGLFIDHLVSRFRRRVAGEARFGPWFDDDYAGILLGEEASARREAIVRAGYESAPRSRRGRASPSPAPIFAQGSPRFAGRCSWVLRCAMDAFSGAATVRPSRRSPR